MVERFMARFDRFCTAPFQIEQRCLIPERRPVRPSPAVSAGAADTLLSAIRTPFVGCKQRVRGAFGTKLLLDGYF